MTAILITEITNGTISGTGAFDELMKAVTAHLEDQYNKGRITGTDYATVYLGSIQSAMAQAVQFVLGKQAADKQADLYAQKILTEEAQISDTVNSVAVDGVIGKQKALFTAQTDGFARDAEQKILKIMTDSYAVRRGTNSVETPPVNLEDTKISNAVADAASKAGLTI